MTRPVFLDLNIQSAAARFWAKVDKSGSCWTWTGAIDPNGYGRFAIKKPVTTGAHRMAYHLAVGPIGKGLCVCHTCDNRKCVRPDHLFVGTQLDNMHDMIRKGRAARGTQTNTPCQVGELNHAAKLSEADVLQILARHRGGDRPTVIAADFGIAYRTVWAIATGKRWGHLQ